MPRLIAYYLPQFHPIRENDEWWGKGFTEWTNTAKAKLLFPGHYQPHVPADLGFYDLRLSEAREAQAAMARQYGIEGFCYYHYWFGNGKRLLERPFAEVLQSGRPDFPFCVCWANETWTGIWHGSPRKVLVEQTYPGEEDEEAHFKCLLSAFRDRRYITIEGKPVFLVYNPRGLPDPRKFVEHWRSLARRAGLKGIYFVGVESEPWKPEEHGFDGSTLKVLHLAIHDASHSFLARIRHRVRRLLGRPPRIFDYSKTVPRFILPEAEKDNIFPTLIPNWDNTPRSGLRGLVLNNSTPEHFRNHMRAVLKQVVPKPSERQMIFVKSWNEWAEGNHLEPDLRYGHQYLQVIAEELAAVRVSDV